jgi:hypothetical protein
MPAQSNPPTRQQMHLANAAIDSTNMLPFECLNYNTPCHIVALATFPPTECLMGPASYLTRVAGDGMGAARGTSVPLGFWEGGPWSYRAPGPVTLIPSARDRGALA